MGLACYSEVVDGTGSGGARDIGRVEDQRDLPVAEDRRRCDAGDVAIASPEAFDDHLPLFHDRIDDQRGPAAIVLRGQKNDA